MFTTKVLRQAAAHAERTPSIRFIGKRTIPASIDHSPQPHPASPTNSLPESFTASAHSSFSAYRDHAQQFGPLRKTIKATGIGGATGSYLGPVAAPKGIFFDRNDLPARFHRQPLTAAEIEAIETGGATLSA
jgi:small subunit ribosomal protein YMR-31